MTEDFSPIGQLENLKYLNLMCESYLFDIDWLYGCKNLEVLY